MARCLKAFGWVAFFGTVAFAGFYHAQWEDSWEGKSHRHFLANSLCPNCLIAQREKQPVPKEFPNTWRKLLNRKVAHYRQLPSHLRYELEPLVLKFIGQVKFKAPDGMKITEEMRVTIAAEACLLILHRGWDCYRHLREVRIYALEWERRSSKPAAVGAANGHMIQIIWKAAKRDMARGSLGMNVVLHEFAHVIDFASVDGMSDGIPLIEDARDRQNWVEFIAGAYQRACQEGGLGRVPLRAYAITNKAEFFACATTLFIEKPYELKRNWPLIYCHLHEFYGLDPASWADEWPRRK